MRIFRVEHKKIKNPETKHNEGPYCSERHYELPDDVQCKMADMPGPCFSYSCFTNEIVFGATKEFILKYFNKDVRKALAKAGYVLREYEAKAKHTDKNNQILFNPKQAVLVSSRSLADLRKAA